MEDLCLKRSYLESLTTGELIHMADSFGIDIPPGLERVFVIGELLDVAADREGEPEAEEAAEVLEEADFRDSVPLPKQYNITFIELLIRDPLWAFVFWEVKSADKELFEKDADFGGYCLRVNPIGNKGEAQRENSFTVPVGNDDTAWYLGFPPGSSGIRYQVELCVQMGLERVVLAVSRFFTMPRLQPPVHSAGSQAGGGSLIGTESAVPADSCLSPLVRLSGAEDFRVIRNADRLSRVRYGFGGVNGSV